MGLRFHLGVIKYSKTDCRDGCKTLNVLKTTEPYPLNE